MFSLIHFFKLSIRNGNSSEYKRERPAENSKS